MPPSPYFASKSYHSALATISPGIEVSRVLVAEHRALDLAAVRRGLDDHPRVVAQRQLDRGVELLERLDPADADARAHPRGLHPERQPELGAALAPARFADRDELDLRDPLLGEEPLQRQLVHADRRGEHVGADVGEVEPLQQPLDRCRPRRRRRAAPGRPTSAPSRPPPGTSSTPAAAADPAPSRPIRTSTHLVPGLPQPAQHRGARAQRDVVLGGAPAGEDRDPHRSFFFGPRMSPSSG